MLRHRDIGQVRVQIEEELEAWINQQPVLKLHSAIPEPEFSEYLRNPCEYSCIEVYAERFGRRFVLINRNLPNTVLYIDRIISVSLSMARNFMTNLVENLSNPTWKTKEDLSLSRYMLSERINDSKKKICLTHEILDL